MKNCIRLLANLVLSSFLVLSLVGTHYSPIEAVESSGLSCNITTNPTPLNFGGSAFGGNVTENTPVTITIQSDRDGLSGTPAAYNFQAWINSERAPWGDTGPFATTVNEGSLTVSFTKTMRELGYSDFDTDISNFTVTIRRTGGGGSFDICGPTTVQVSNNAVDPALDELCGSRFNRWAESGETGALLRPTTTWPLSVQMDNQGFVIAQRMSLNILKGGYFETRNFLVGPSGAVSSMPVEVLSTPPVPGTYDYYIESTDGPAFSCEGTFEVVAQSIDFDPDDEDPEIPVFQYCDQIPFSETQLKSQCTSCYNRGGLWTAIGCLDRDESKMVDNLFNIGLSIGGGLAMLLILYGGFTLTISSGDPEKIQTGKSVITSAVAGLAFVILSAVLLRFIGVDILGIPGF